MEQKQINEMTDKEILSKVLDMLYTLEDRNNYEDIEIGKVINTLQELL